MREYMKEREREKEREENIADKVMLLYNNRIQFETIIIIIIY